MSNFNIDHKNSARTHRSFDSDGSEMRSSNNDAIDLELDPNKVYEHETFVSDYYHRQKDIIEMI
jgi:hypothetical protein